MNTIIQLVCLYVNISLLIYFGKVILFYVACSSFKLPKKYDDHMDLALKMAKQALAWPLWLPSSILCFIARRFKK